MAKQGLLIELDWPSFAFGVGAFVAVSYVLHCHFNMGPWPCQRADPRRSDSLEVCPERHHHHDPRTGRTFYGDSCCADARSGAGAPPCPGLGGIHPDHPSHPYRNGVPAVWGGREIRY